MRDAFSIRVNRLVSDPDFVRYSTVTNEPNIFNIVGRSRYERWHSAFLGWLLDPEGSHNLKDYVLRRTLITLFTEKCVKPAGFSEVQNAVLTGVEIINPKVRPNEHDHSEASIDVGRLDVYVTGRIIYSDLSESDLNIIIEVKVETKTRSEQSKKYADWLINNHPHDINLLIYLLPRREMGSTPEATVGDERWFCIDFQMLHDEILLPALEHPDLNPKVAPFITQYVNNLRIPFKGNKMAITEEEKKLARALYEKYSDVFDSISEALRTEGIEFEVESSSSQSTRGSGRIAVMMDGRVIEGNSVGELFRVALKYLVDSGLVNRMAMPWGTGRSRYIISNDFNPQHPNGRSFFAPIAYQGYTLESHMDRARSVKVLEELSKHLELDFSLVEV